MEGKGGKFQKRVHDVNGLGSFARTETSQHQQLARRIDQNSNKKSKANAATPKMIPFHPSIKVGYICWQLYNL